MGAQGRRCRFADGGALLGYILTSGPEEMRDVAAAEQWYRRSAEADCPQGRLGLGLALLRNAAGPEHYAEGASQLAAAAEAGLAAAEYLLGVLYEQGLGVERNLERGIALYGAAAEKGCAPPRRVGAPP